jgi:acyl carrier protein
MKDIQSKVVLILKEVRPDQDFSSSKNFVEDGMLDSFDIVNLVTSLDEQFFISIAGTEIIPDNFISVESICSLLSKYVKE